VRRRRRQPNEEKQKLKKKGKEERVNDGNYMCTEAKKIKGPAGYTQRVYYLRISESCWLLLLCYPF
jgi:hypothetical protein